MVNQNGSQGQFGSQEEDEADNPASENLSEEARLAKVVEMMRNCPADIRSMYFGSRSAPPPESDQTDALLDCLIQFCRSSERREDFVQFVGHESNDMDTDLGNTNKMFLMNRKIERVYRLYGTSLPQSIWTCCKKVCFASLATKESDFVVFDDVIRVHEVAMELHRQIDQIKERMHKRRLGVGGSKFVFVSETRMEREAAAGQLSTERKQAVEDLRSYISEVLPFLHGLAPAPTGGSQLKQALCTKAICGILRVSTNFLYAKKESDADGGGKELSSLLDDCGLRRRQLRTCGERGRYPKISELPAHECGCESGPCFAGVSPGRLHFLFQEFCRISRQKKSPRKLENRYLLDVMFSRLTNSAVKTCNTAISLLYTVSVERIADVRRVVDAMCFDPSEDDDGTLRNGISAYNKKNPDKWHPANKFSREIRESIERQLDMILRADPSSEDGWTTYRVYSPDINTHAKLREALAEHLGEEGENVELSSSTLQRMINNYLAEKKSRIKYLQSDHNACPSCKTMQLCLLHLRYTLKRLKRRRDRLLAIESRKIDEEEELSNLNSDLELKTFREKTVFREFEVHNLRDAAIRKWLKIAIDHFRGMENAYRDSQVFGCSGWRQRPFNAMITHQDDMTKVDLPTFVVNASSDITRWRYDVNAHINAVTDECIVFSSEQGGGSKSASSVAELILLDHILRCRGEGIKVVVSDNASVGKNWLTCVALPQYLVDQGLADIVIVVFLENNHGKWLADQLFGQFQIRKDRSTIVGIDGLLREFESINKKSGVVRGFAVNPLSSVHLGTVLASLGYETECPKDFGFIKRNVHFAAACNPAAKEKLKGKTKEILGDLLPSHHGCVRLCSSPPSGIPQEALPFNERGIEVPAASIDGKSETMEHTTPELLSEPPLTVPLDHPYSASGKGVVSTRNMKVVGYNGLAFRNLNACPELRAGDGEFLTRESWPKGLLECPSEEEPLPVSESLKCAPENWIVRRPCSHFAGSNIEQCFARYPPRNMLNAKYERPPRNAEGWIPVATYREGPFPSITDASSLFALQEFGEGNVDPSMTPNTMDLLRCVFRLMGDRDHCRDLWLQFQATRSSIQARSQYFEAIALWKARERGHPKPAITIRKAFDEDPENTTRAQEIKRQGNGRNLSLAKIKAALFREAERTPAALDKYRSVVEADLERYSLELKHFREVVQKDFDVQNRLLPVQVEENSQTMFL